MPKFNVKNKKKSNDNALKLITCESIKQKSTLQGTERVVEFVLKPDQLINLGWQFITVEATDEGIVSMPANPVNFNNKLRETDFQTTGVGTIHRFDISTLLPETADPPRGLNKTAKKQTKIRTIQTTPQKVLGPAFRDFGESCEGILSRGGFKYQPNDSFPGLTQKEIIGGKRDTMSDKTKISKYFEQPTIEKIHDKKVDYTAKAKIGVIIKNPNHTMKYFLYKPATGESLELPLNPSALQLRTISNWPSIKKMNEGAFPQKLNYTTLDDMVIFDHVFNDISHFDRVSLWKREFTSDPINDNWEKIASVNLDYGTNPSSRYFRYACTYNREKNYIFRLVPVMNQVDYPIYAEAVVVNAPYNIPQPYFLITQNPTVKNSSARRSDLYYRNKVDLKNIGPGITEVKVIKYAESKDNVPQQVFRLDSQRTSQPTHSAWDMHRSIDPSAVCYEVSYKYSDIEFKTQKKSFVQRHEDPLVPRIWAEHKELINIERNADSGHIRIFGNLLLSNNYIYTDNDNFYQPSSELEQKVLQKQLVPWIRVTRIDNSNFTEELIGEFPLWKATSTEGINITPTYEESGITFEIIDSNELAGIRGISRLPRNIVYKLEYAAYPLSYLIFQYNNEYEITQETESTSLNYTRNWAYWDAPQYTKYGVYPQKLDLLDVAKQHEYAYTPECFILDIKNTSSGLTNPSLTCGLVKEGVELKFKIPDHYKDDKQIDFIQLIARPTNLKKGQLINTIYPTVATAIYYDFDTPRILCDEIEYTAKFYNKKFEMVSYATKSVALDGLTSRNITSRSIQATASQSVSAY